MKSGDEMDKKNSFVKNVACFTLCGTLLWGSFSFGGKVGEANNKLFSIFEKLSYNSTSADIKSFSSYDDVYISTGYSSGSYKSAAVSSTPTDIKTLKKQAEELFKNYTKAGNIKETQMGATSKTITYGKVKIDNKTSDTVNVKKLLDTAPEYKKITKDDPYILIYHTHSTEGYEMLDLGWYSEEYNSRTDDKAKNMVRVGDELTRVLEQAGFNVIHDRNIYDKNYNGAYSRSRVSVESYLKKYPSIQITLDVHRDAIHYDSGTRCKPTAEINGKKAAQVMIISGCEGNGVEDFPDYIKNLGFATHLQNEVEEKYESLMRPIFFCNRKYNMDVTPCSLLLEFGTDANTLEEAVYSAYLIGTALANMLEENIK